MAFPHATASNNLKAWIAPRRRARPGRASPSEPRRQLWRKQVIRSCQSPRQKFASAAAAADQRRAAGEQLLFREFCICCTYSSHENSSPSGPLFLCETHLISSVFRGTRFPGGGEEISEYLPAAWRTISRSTSQRVITACGCGLAFPIIPRFPETKRFPAEAFRGVPEEENQAQSWSEEKWE